jgi:hypothetical protein
MIVTRAPTMSGPYNVSDGSTWFVTPCGPDCLKITGAHTTGTWQANLVDGQWAADVDAIFCKDRSAPGESHWSRAPGESHWTRTLSPAHIAIPATESPFVAMGQLTERPPLP